MTLHLWQTYNVHKIQCNTICYLYDRHVMFNSKISEHKISLTFHKFVHVSYNFVHDKPKHQNTEILVHDKPKYLNITTLFMTNTNFYHDTKIPKILK